MAVPDKSDEHKRKWLRAERLLSAKMCLDSLLYIANLGVENVVNPYSLCLDLEVNRLRRDFYIECGIFLDEYSTVFNIRKSDLRNDLLVANDIYYERDKHSAHNDSDYVHTNWSSLSDMYGVMKSQYCAVLEYCSGILPGSFVPEFVSHDSKLFRMIYGVTPDFERDIMRRKHPLYGVTPDVDKENVIKFRIFNSSTDIEMSSNEECESAGILLQAGLILDETIQNFQRAFVVFNIMSGYDTWVHFTDERYKFRQLVDIGFMDVFECFTDPHRWTKDMFDRISDANLRDEFIQRKKLLCGLPNREERRRMSKRKRGKR